MNAHKTNNLLLAICPVCGKRVLHPRGDSDPIGAVWCELECDDCAVTGNKEYTLTFYGKYGEMYFDMEKEKWFYGKQRH